MELNFLCPPGKFLENSNKYYSLICFLNCAKTRFSLAHHHRAFYKSKTSSSLGSGLKQSSFVKIFQFYLVAQSLSIRVVLRTQIMFTQRSLEQELFIFIESWRIFDLNYSWIFSTYYTQIYALMAQQET